MPRSFRSLLSIATFAVAFYPQASAQNTLAPDLQQASNTTPPTGFLASFEARAHATLVNEPHWSAPLVTTDAGIGQGIRSDFVRQTTPTGQSTWNLGNTKGLQIIPLPRLEVRISPPPFFLHASPSSPDGFGDIAFRLKYRLYGSNEEHHNAILTAILSASIPTGKNGNGSCCAILTPSIELGKGFGKLALTVAPSASLPESNTIKLGRSFVLNNAIQYHATHLLWIETEFNSTFYFGGKYDGKQQTFTTPGIIISRFPLPFIRDASHSPLRLTLGAGEQIALTHFNTYNHAPIFTARLRF
jgi:hypothetical protein